MSSTWLQESVERVSADPSVIGALFPAVGRRTGRQPVVADDPQGLLHGTVDDAGRAELLRALHLLEGLGDACVDVVHDGLRSNDVRLVAAAVGPYGAQHLDQAAFRQAVVKCLFVGVPLAAVADLDRRNDAELARMAARLVQERVAAGRAVPADVWRLLAPHPEALEDSGVLRELGSPVEERREAARRFLDSRPATISSPAASPES